MALIRCKECGKEISGTAKNCPNCGALTEHGKNQTQGIFDAIHALLLFAGICLGIYWFFSSVGSVKIIFEALENYNSKYYGFFEYLEYRFGDAVFAVFLKFFGGIGLIVGGLVGMSSLKKIERRKYASWSAMSSGKTGPSQARNYPTNMEVASRDEWKCSGCGRIHKAYVSTCVCGHNRNDRTVQAAEETASNPETKDTVFCPGCGTEFGKDVRFCTNCGTKLKD